VIHGARCYFVLDGRPVAYGQGVSFSWAITQTPIKVLGSKRTVEHVATDYNISNFTIEVVELVRRSLIDLGIQPTLDTALPARELTIEIKDNPSDTAMYVLEGVKFESSNFSLRHGQPTMQGVNLVARGLRDHLGRM
jgi:hypothetical protein